MSRNLESLLDPQRVADCIANDQAMRTFTRASVRYITTPSGVRIGSAYQPKPPIMSADHERLQAALFDPRTAKPLTGWRRILGFFWREC